MNGIIRFFYFMYPLWGIVCIDLFCKKFAASGTFSERALRALIIGFLATLIFTPIWYSTGRFDVIVPWPTYLAAPESSSFYWPFSLITFILGFIGALLASGKPKERSVAPNAMNIGTVMVSLILTMNGLIAFLWWVFAGAIAGPSVLGTYILLNSTALALAIKGRIAPGIILSLLFLPIMFIITFSSSS